MEDRLKKYDTVGCCGIDCGLCPRFYIVGDSFCPGCGGLNFKEKHPSCGYVSCCAVNKGLEACSECIEFPCRRFETEKKGYDSFVSHKMIFPNLEYIKRNGIEGFIEQQNKRMIILKYFLENYDEGRSKSFFCISCALLPLDSLLEIHSFITSQPINTDLKEKNRQLKNLLSNTANALQIELVLRKK